MKISTHFDRYKFSFTLNYGPHLFYRFNFVPVTVQPLQPDTNFSFSVGDSERFQENIHFNRIAIYCSKSFC